MAQDLMSGAGFLEPGQRNAEIVYNDMLLRLSVLSADCVDSIGPSLPTTVTAPYLMILDGTHATRPNQIAYYWAVNQWFYVAPIKYQIYNNLADNISYQFTGTAWGQSAFGGGGGTGGVTIAQVNTAIASHASGANHGSSYLTQSAGDARYLTQTTGDGRYPLSTALSELIDDRVAQLLVVSSGGTLTYDDALNRLTLAITAISGGTGRVTMTTDRTYHVRSGGARTGPLTSETDATTNVDADAFSSPSLALLALAKLDANGFIPTLKLDGSTYTVNELSLPSIVGCDKAVLETSAGTILQSSNSVASPAGVISLAQNSTSWEVKGPGTVQLTSSSVSRGLIFVMNGFLKYRDLNFGLGNPGLAQLWSAENGLIYCTGNYSISAGAGYHYWANIGNIRCQSFSINIANTPNFFGAFANADYSGKLVQTGCTFSGTGATGKRYSANNLGQIITGGAGANYFPGSIPGTPVPSPTEAQMHSVSYGLYS